MYYGDLQAQFGRNLREHRKRLGLSQEGLADELDLHRTYIGGIERGERNLTLKTIEAIAERLGVEPIDLLRPSEDIK